MIPDRLLIHTVAVYAQVVAPGVDCEPVRTYAPRAGLNAAKCRVVELSGRELLSYQMAGRETTAILYFRGDVGAGIAPTDLIVWGDLAFEAQAARDVHGLGHHVEVPAVARPGAAALALATAAAPAPDTPGPAPALAAPTLADPLPGIVAAPPGAVFYEGGPFRAAAGSVTVGPDLVLAATAQILSARFACSKPATAPAAGTWRAIVQVQPAGTSAAGDAVDVATLAFDLAAAPIDLPFTLATPYPVGPGDAIRCGLVPVGNPTALDAPTFTVLLE